MQKIICKSIQRPASALLSFVLLLCAAACAPAPDEEMDVYVKYESNAQGSIDKEAAEKHAAEARILVQLEMMEDISSAKVYIGESGHSGPVNVTLTLAEGAVFSEEMEKTIKNLISSSLAGSSEDEITVTVEG